MGYQQLYLRILAEGIPATSTAENNRGTLAMTTFVTKICSTVSYSPQSPHRRFIITQKGLLGLGTPDCREGDTVCTLFGYIFFPWQCLCSWSNAWRGKTCIPPWRKFDRVRYQINLVRVKDLSRFQMSESMCFGKNFCRRAKV
jgi:hypothetical protein